MEEAENTSVEQQVEEPVAHQESAAPSAEANQEQVSDQSQVKSQELPDQQNKSWIKKLRRDRDELTRKTQMQEELIKQLMTVQQQPQAKSSTDEEDIYHKVQQQEYVAGTDVVKALHKQKEEFNRELAELKKASEDQRRNSLFQDLKRELPDFEDVVNPDTLALLDETYPRLAQAIAKNKDPYDASVLAYETIKAKGLIDQVPDARRAKEVEKKLEQSKKTVQSPQSFSQRPMAQAFRMPETKKEKEALWAETLKYANMGGGGY